MLDNMPFYTEDRVSMQKAYYNTLLVFVEITEKADPKTGEIYYISKNKYLNLTFTFRLNNEKSLERLTVRGSVHTFFNKGLHNANIITFKDFTKSLDSYTELFGIDLKKCRLLPFEYGNNLFLNEFSNYDVDDIIMHTYCIKRKMFNCNAGIETSKISGRSTNEVRIKFYSKSANYPKYCKNTLRIEDKLTKVRGVEKKGIVYVSDLYKIENHFILLEKHLENISKIVLYDYTMVIPKNSKYVKEARKFSNPSYWRKLINNCKKGEEYDTKYNDKVNLLNFLSKEYGQNMLACFVQIIENQSLKALGVCGFSKFIISRKPKYAQYKKPKNAQLYIECIPNCFIDADVSNVIGLSFTSIGVKKYCKVTGFDISMQKDNSTMLSSSGIRYYHKNYFNLFKKIRKNHLTNKWVNSDLETQFYHIAHNIRDTKRNSELKQKRLYLDNQLILFDLPPSKINKRYYNLT